MNVPPFLPGEAVAPAALHAAFERAFADYLVGPFTLAPSLWPGFLARQAVDLALSRVAFGASGEIDAFALVAPRHDVRRWRLATMGAVPAARGGGAARRLLEDFIGRAAAAGMAAAELEVFAQNERALRLYAACGFEARHELQGWRWPAGRATSSQQRAVQTVDASSAWAWLRDTLVHVPQLPLQVTPQVLAALDTGTALLRTWQAGSAQLVFSEPALGPLRVLSLVDRRPAQDDARHLVESLLAAHGARGIEVPQLQRPDVGGLALQRAGFERLPLHQLLMFRPLC